MKQIFSIFLLLMMSFNVLADEKNSINISAEGKVKAQPDMASFAIAVDMTELDSNQAHSKVDKLVKVLLRKLEGFEIQDGSLDSSQTSIQAEYDYSVKPKKLMGYRATRQVQFNLLDLKQLDDLLSDLSRLDHTNLNSIQYAMKDSQYLEDLALINAIQIAKQKAELIANEFNKELAGILKVNHQVSSTRPFVHARAMSLEMDMKSSSFEQKEIETSAFIEVAFEIK